MFNSKPETAHASALLVLLILVLAVPISEFWADVYMMDHLIDSPSTKELKILKIAAYRGSPWLQIDGRLVQILKNKQELIERLDEYDILILDGFATARLDAEEIATIKRWISVGGIGIFVVRGGYYVYDPGHYKLAVGWTNPSYPDMDSWGGILNISTCETENDWCVRIGLGKAINLSTEAVEGTYSVLIEGLTSTNGWLSVIYNATLKPLNLTALQSLKLHVKVNATVRGLSIAIWDTFGLKRLWRIGPIRAGEWSRIALPINFTHHIDEHPDLSQITLIEIRFRGEAITPYKLWVDWLYGEKRGTLLDEVAGLTIMDFRKSISYHYSVYIPSSATDGRFVITNDKNTILANMANVAGYYHRQSMYPIDNLTTVLLWLVDTCRCCKPQPLLAVKQYGSGYAYTINAAFDSLYQDVLDFHGFRFINVTDGSNFNLLKFLFKDILTRTKLAENVRIGIIDKPIVIVTTDEGWAPKDKRPGYYRLRNLADGLGFRATWFITAGGPSFPFITHHQEEFKAFLANLSYWGQELANHVWRHARVDRCPALVPGYIAKMQEYLRANASYLPVGFKPPGYKYNWTNIYALEQMGFEYAAITDGADYGFGFWCEETSPYSSEPIWDLPKMRYDYFYNVFYVRSSHLSLPAMRDIKDYYDVLKWAIDNGWPLIVFYGHRDDWDNDTRYEITKKFLMSTLANNTIYMMTLRQFVHVYLALRTANITTVGNELRVTITVPWNDTNYFIAVLDRTISRVLYDDEEYRAFTEHLVILPTDQGLHDIIIRIGEPVLPRLIWGNTLQTCWLLLHEIIYTTNIMRISAVLPPTPVILRIYTKAMPSNIIIAGKNFANPVSTMSELERALGSCWFFDSNSSSLYIKVMSHSYVEIIIDWSRPSQPPNRIDSHYQWIMLSFMLLAIVGILCAYYYAKGYKYKK